MALETVSVSVSDAAYTAVGINVTALTMTEKRVSDMLVHIVATGGTAPTLASDGQWFDKEYTYTGPPADIYVTSPSGAAIIGVVRE